MTDTHDDSHAGALKPAGRGIDSLAAERSTAFERGLASMSHALATPLQVIRGRASLIASETGDPAVLEHVRVIERKLRELSDFLRDFLEFARGADDREELDVRNVVSEVIVQSQSFAPDVTVESISSPDAATIVASRELLLTVVSGVLEDVTAGCPPKALIRSRVENVDGCACWTVDLPHALSDEWTGQTHETWMSSLHRRGRARARVLRLGIVLGALKRLGAAHEIRSTAGDRWTLTISFSNEAP
jgi:K+-sensing histidine kinase KdpD